MNSRTAVFTAIGVLSVLIWNQAAPVAVQVRHDSISGRVFNSSSGAGVSGLSVHLTAPRAMQLPVKVTMTGANGEFRFERLPGAGKYLLEIYQGTTLVFRREIDNTVESDFVVSLRPVPS